MHLRHILNLLAVASLALSTPTHAQTPPTPSPSATPTLAFDVVSIKPAKPGAPGSGTDTNNDTFTATNITLKALMQYDAYGIPGSQILGISPELEKVTFDIQAKFDPSAYPQAQMSARGQYSFGQQMMQQLLADKFKLAVHTETRQLPVYALVIANPKTGPKLQPATDPSGMHMSSGNGQLKAKGVTAADLSKALTSILQNELGRVIIDKTNLTGKYDLTLKWTPSMGSPPMLNGQPDTSAPDIFTAVQEQLGLKLESAKAPVPVLVVDHAELPSEN
jgi:uncharacterized protein (TIGR03435 family)